MTYRELRDALAKLTPEQLEQQVYASDWWSTEDWEEIVEMHVAERDVRLGDGEDDDLLVRQGMPILLFDS